LGGREKPPLACCKHESPGTQEAGKQHQKEAAARLAVWCCLVFWVMMDRCMGFLALFVLLVRVQEAQICWHGVEMCAQALNGEESG